MDRRFTMGALLALTLVVAAPAGAVAAPNNNNSAKLTQAVTLDGVARAPGRAAGGSPTPTAAPAPMARRATPPRRSTSMTGLAAAGYSPQFQDRSRTRSTSTGPPRCCSGSAPSQQPTAPGTDYESFGVLRQRRRDRHGRGGGTSWPPPAPTTTSTSGCEAGDFAGFAAGNIALIQRGGCPTRQGRQGPAAGASGVIVFNEGQPDRPNAGPGGTLGGPGIEHPGRHHHLRPRQGAERGVPQRPNRNDRPDQGSSRGERQTRRTRNVVAETPGGRPEPDGGGRCPPGQRVIEGPGINDNGSGTAANLEIAANHAARGRSRGTRSASSGAAPRRRGWSARRLRREPHRA